MEQNGAMAVMNTQKEPTKEQTKSDYANVVKEIKISESHTVVISSKNQKLSAAETTTLLKREIDIQGSGIQVMDIRKDKKYPVTLVYKNCTTILRGINPCEMSINSHPGFKNFCDYKTTTTSLVLPLILGIVVILEWVLLRHLWVTKHMRIGAFKLVSYSGKFPSYNFKLAPASKVKMFFSSKNEDCMPSSSPPTYRFAKTTLFTYTLLVLFFISPGMTNGMETRILEAKAILGNLIHPVQEDGLVSLGDVIWRADKMRFEYPLHWCYDTAEFRVETFKDWHCTRSACDSHGRCEEYGYTGEFSSSVLYFDPKKEWSHITRRRYCVIFDNGCTLGTACWKWVSEVKKLFSVFDLGSSRQVVSFSGRKSNNCKITSFLLSKGVGSKESSIIKTHRDQWYYCPYSSKHKFPQADALGDFQIGKNWSFTNYQRRNRKNVN